jgi:hypothetical protein
MDVVCGAKSKKLQTSKSVDLLTRRRSSLKDIEKTGAW